ncbi:MAG: hypothetical protein WA970_16540 [Gammaproteobacteria bacterium]
MLRKMMLMATGAALGLGVTMSSLAAETFSAIAVLQKLDISEMVMVADDGQRYRLSPELIPNFQQQQSKGQLGKGTLIRVSGHYGRTHGGEREPVVEHIQRLAR